MLPPVIPGGELAITDVTCKVFSVRVMFNNMKIQAIFVAKILATKVTIMIPFNWDVKMHFVDMIFQILSFVTFIITTFIFTNAGFSLYNLWNQALFRQANKLMLLPKLNCWKLFITARTRISVNNASHPCFTFLFVIETSRKMNVFNYYVT